MTTEMREVIVKVQCSNESCGKVEEIVISDMQNLDAKMKQLKEETFECMICLFDKYSEVEKHEVVIYA